MTEQDKKKFKTVPAMDMDEYKQKIREHRLKILKRTLVTALIVFVIIAGLFLFLALRHYEDFDVNSTVERSDTAATIFEEFQGNILKYSNDGALYTDTYNERIWNQTYEMTDPQIDICEDYLTIYDKKGTMIYIMTKEGILGGIETTMPIQQVRVASQGTVAVLMKKDASGYLAMYDKTGAKLTEGEIHGAKKGYPVAIALSSDAVRLAVAMLDINDGSIKSTIAFYNFGTAGESEIDHVVGAQTFPDTVIPEIVYLADDRLAAFSDTGVILFEGSQKPKQSGTIPFEKEVKSIFYNDNYIGCVISNEDEAVTHHISVYDLDGKSVLEKDFTMEYTGVEFLANNEICITNENACDIYTIHGIYKFHHEFEQTLYKIISESGALNYTLILEDTTEKIRLK
mgnify:CR=1 FL=1